MPTLPPEQTAGFDPPVTPGVVGRVLAPAVVGAVLLYAVLEVLLAIGKIDPPSRIDRFDRAVLDAKVALATGPRSWDWVILGDSSALMNVSAPLLGARLPAPTNPSSGSGSGPGGGEAAVLNLATFSFLGLDDHARLLQARIEASRRGGNPASADLAPASKRVLLLLHPQSLRKPDSSPVHVATLARGLGAPADREMLGPGWNPVSRASALGREVLDSLLPGALKGGFAETFGYTADVRAYVLRQDGSLVEPIHRVGGGFAGDPYFELSPRLEGPSHRFGRVVQEAGLTLVVGITPVPESFALKDHADRIGRMARQWQAWLGPGVRVVELPSVLPDRYFGSLTHLNPEGQQLYTRHLARALEAGR